MGRRKGEVMGPFSDLPEVPGVDRAPDHAARAAAFVRRHRHVSVTATPQGWTASWTEACAGPGDGEPRHESREHLGWLMDYLEARFDRGEPALPKGHEIVPQRRTAYSIGPRYAGNPADLRNALHYPVEAVCRCGKRIVCDRMILGEWRHEEREP
jgi:hypothetical protein